MKGRTASKATLSLPPGLDSHPLIQAYRFATRPLELLDECQQRFGELFRLRLAGLGDWVLLSSPKDLKTMFSGSPEVLHAGEANLSVFAPILGDSSVISLEERAHLERRRLLLPPFHGEQVQAYFQDMCDCAGQIVGSWHIGRPFSMHHEAQRITLRVILKVIFGVRRDAEHGPLARLIISLANVIASPLIFMPALQWDLGRYSPWGKIMHINQQTDIAIHEAIKQRRAAPLGEGKQDLFALLLEAKREDGEGLSDRELRDELLTMLLAGHETTATALAWTFERILSLPEVYAKVMEELDIVFSPGARSPDRVPKLEYLDAVIKETHRFRPIMPIGGSRRVKAPFAVGGYMIPPGATLSNCMYLLHRRPDIYPEPEQFRPERFLGKNVDPNEWTPFGGGVRRCLGMAFAHLEMKAVLATVLSRARLRTLNPHAKIKRRGFFLIPDKGPRVVVQAQKR